jgi:hypothetical protein
MTTDTTQTALIAELERLFDHFKGKLFSVSCHGTPRNRPVFRCDFWKKFSFRYSKETKYFVVGLGVKKLSYEELICEFVHEMIHWYNDSRGKSDCTPSQYHNQAFFRTATCLGFYVLKHPTRGWGLIQLSAPTSGTDYLPPNDEDRDYLSRLIDKFDFDHELFQLAKQEMRENSHLFTRKQCQLKYQCACPPPHNTIRSGRHPNGKYPLCIRCDKCGHHFKLADEDDNA